VLDTLTELRIGVFGISLDSEEETHGYVAEQGLRFPVVRFPERKLSQLYRTSRVPHDAAGP
jgi:peroxiredoxin